MGEIFTSVFVIYLTVSIMGALFFAFDRTSTQALGWAIFWPVVVIKKAWRGMKVITRE